MKKIFLLTISSLVLLACKNEPESNHSTNESNDADEKVLVGEITHIQTLFDETAFPDENHAELLKELNICDTLPPEVSGCASCTPRYFKLHEFKQGAKLSDAFMVQIRALTVLKGQDVQLPVRHLLVFERENGTLVKTNGFRGNLIATRESANGAKDLIVRFYVAEDDAFMNCLFVWKDGKYKFQSVEAIDGAGGSGSVKSSVKDSVSTIVYQSLMSNGMLF